jgi:hypothetical protein
VATVEVVAGVRFTPAPEVGFGAAQSVVGTLVPAVKRTAAPYGTCINAAGTWLVVKASSLFLPG